MAWHGRGRRVAGLAMLAGMLGLSGAGGRAQTGPPPLTLHLTTNQAILGPGSTLEATVGVTYTGAPQAVDLLFGAILPDGDSVVAFGPGMASASARVSRLSTIPVFYGGLTLAPGVHAMVPDLLRYNFNGSEPLGTYRLFFAATTPGAFKDDRIDPGDVVAVQFADIVVRAPATVTVDPSHAGTALVPRTGGTVTATGADGTTYTLTVPSGALAQPTTITLTPVTSLTGAPGGLQHTMAVRAMPEGLTFAIPATLAIVPPAGGPTGGWLGVSTTGAGGGLGVLPAVRSQGTIVVAGIVHFSVLGVAVPDLAQLQFSGSATTAAYLARLSAAATAQEKAAIYHEWDRVVLSPLLLSILPSSSGVLNPSALIAAMAEFYVWDFISVGDAPLEAAGRLDALSSRVLIGDGLQAALDTLQGRCLAAPALPVAEEVLQWRALASSYLRELWWERMVPGSIPSPRGQEGGFLDDYHYFDLDAVLPLLCVKAEIVNISFPGTIQQGVATPMSVQAGLRFTNGQITPTPPLQIAIDATGATPAQRTGLTNGAGTYATTFTPTSGSLTFDITAALVDGNYPYLSLAPLLATTRLTRTTGGVVVTPSQTTIAPGQSRQFTANQSVTWTVSGGGIITSSGMFTSNSTQGVFFVTATSVVDPTEVGIAQVTVQAPTLGSFFLSVGNAGARGSAVVNGVTRAFSRPAAQAQLVADEMIQHLGSVSFLETVQVQVFADGLQTAVSLDVNLGGFDVGGLVELSIYQGGGGACTMPSPPNLRLTVGNVTGPVSLSPCDGVAELAAGTVGGNITVPHVGAAATARLRASRAGRVQISGCVGHLEMNTGISGALDLHASPGCAASFAGSTFSESIRIENAPDATLGQISASTLSFVKILFAQNSSLALQVGAITGPATGPAFYLGWSTFSLSDLDIASITGPVEIEGNRGFSDLDAHGFLVGIGHTGPRRIIGNTR